MFGVRGETGTRTRSVSRKLEYFIRSRLRSSPATSSSDRPTTFPRIWRRQETGTSNPISNRARRSVRECRVGTRGLAGPLRIAGGLSCCDMACGTLAYPIACGPDMSNLPHLFVLDVLILGFDGPVPCRCKRTSILRGTLPLSSAQLWIGVVGAFRPKGPLTSPMYAASEVCGNHTARITLLVGMPNLQPTYSTDTSLDGCCIGSSLTPIAQ